ncbi:uncharacterized protein LOC126778279 isoform X2 [Nymphalis io]|uniref:uncharacterized protein LOC126778279 isoform X2 n=1 Tax=Inachis io TaxID=171585 RepID=UPI0021676F4F|nr:uncharacterized protein LOC126778279 isoform X2 [Nymphalis io]
MFSIFRFISGIVKKEKPLHINESKMNSLSQDVHTAVTQPLWMSNLRTRIDQYIKKYGYQDAKLHIKKLVEETENKENVLLNVKVAHNGIIDVDFGPVLRSSKRKKENKRGFDIEPQWLIEFKEFIQELIQNYGREKVENMIEHFIKTIETKHVVKIKDIDVNPYGEVSVKYEYIRKSHKRKKGPRLISSEERSRQMSSEERIRATKTIQDY